MVPDITWFETVANSLLAVLTGVALVLGSLYGSKKANQSRGNSSASGTTLEIAGALVSDAHAKAIIESVNQNTDAINRSTEAIHDLEREIIRHHR